MQDFTSNGLDNLEQELVKHTAMSSANSNTANIVIQSSSRQGFQPDQISPPECAATSNKLNAKGSTCQSRFKRRHGSRQASRKTGSSRSITNENGRSVKSNENLHSTNMFKHKKVSVTNIQFQG